MFQSVATLWLTSCYHSVSVGSRSHTIPRRRNVFSPQLHPLIQTWSLAIKIDRISYAVSTLQVNSWHHSRFTIVWLLVCVFRVSTFPGKPVCIILTDFIVYTTLYHMVQRHETSHAVQDNIGTVDYTDHSTNIHPTGSRMTVCIQAMCLTAWLQLQREVQWLTYALTQQTENNTVLWMLSVDELHSCKGLHLQYYNTYDREQREDSWSISAHPISCSPCH